MKTIAAVLAAGESKRLGRPKQLLLYRGEPLVRHAARVALGAGCDETIVIVQPGALREELRDLPVTLVDNPDFREGMSSSIRLVAQMDARLLITLADQPLVTSDHLRELLAIDAPIVATRYTPRVIPSAVMRSPASMREGDPSTSLGMTREVAGVPAVFGVEMLDELRGLTGDRGARAVIAAHANVTRSIVFEPASVDIDTIADLELLGA